MTMRQEGSRSYYYDGNGLAFSSSKCPSGPGLANTCELPFGFIWTPFLPDEHHSSHNSNNHTDNNNSSSSIKNPKTTTTVVVVPPYYDDENDGSGSSSLPPGVICLTCLSYLSVYAEMDMMSGKWWKCPLCGAKNALPPSSDLSTPNGSLVAVLASPTIEFRQSILPRSTSHRVSPMIDATTIVLVLDRNLLPTDAQGVGNTIQSILPGLLSSPNQQINLGLIVFGKDIAIYQLGVSGMASADILATHDENLQLGKEEHEKSYLKQIDPDDNLDCLWRCLAAQFGIALPNEEEEVEPNTTAAAAAGGESATSSFSGGTSSSRMDKLRQRKEARLRKRQAEEVGAKLVVLKSPWTLAKERAAGIQSRRCTGEAIQCAIDLASVHTNVMPRTARILLFTNGCPSYGDGSVVPTVKATTGGTGSSRERKVGGPRSARTVDPMALDRAKEYFSVIGKVAADGGVGVDVLCTGATELGIAAYQALVEPSSGYVISHDSFTSRHLTANLDYLLKQTYMSGLYEDTVEERSLPKSWVDGCTLDIRMPSFVELTHIIGTGEFLDEDKGLLDNERPAYAAGAKMAAGRGIPTSSLPSEDIIECTLTRIHCGRYDPMSTFSAMLRINEFFQREEHTYFQCVVRYIDRDGTTMVTRVSTQRLSRARDIGSYLDSVDEEVVAVLLGKQAAYRSMHGREDNGATVEATEASQLERFAYDAQTDLDATIQRISGAYRLLNLEAGARGLDLTEEGGTKAAGSSMDFAFPPELSDALRRLYHLRRGPLISPGPLQSMDDRSEDRSLFLRSPLERCLSMMAPSLWTASPPLVGDQATLESVPPETLALWPHCIIAADHGQNLFLWSGQKCLGREFDSIRAQCRQFLDELSSKRFPLPRLHILSEGDSMSRRFTSILAPSHGDSEEQQKAHFPALHSLAPDVLAELRSKFRFYDPVVDPTFRSWFWEVASATSESRGIGTSLCE